MNVHYVLEHYVTLIFLLHLDNNYIKKKKLKKNTDLGIYIFQISSTDKTTKHQVSITPVTILNFYDYYFVMLNDF